MSGNLSKFYYEGIIKDKFLKEVISMSQITIKNLSFSYSDKKILDDISINISQGEFITLCGKTGCGKTTFLRLLKRELKPNGNLSGEIFYNNILQDELDEKTSVCKIGFVMQNPDSQIITDKVYHELAFGLESLGLDNSAIKRKIAETACYFGIEDLFYKKISELSGGQKQLLNLASITAMNPEIMILDEPTAQLDPIARESFLNTLKKLNHDLSVTVIIAEHTLEDILPMSDRLIAIENGRIIYNDSPKNICTTAKTNPYLFIAMPSAVKISTPFLKANEPCPLTTKDVIKHISDNLTVKPIQIPQKTHLKNIVLEVKDVSFRYSKDSADILHDLSLKLFENEILFVLGGNGAGKTTFLNTVAGLLKYRTGSIRLFGKKLSTYKDKTLYQNNIALLPQDVKAVFARDTVEEEFAETSAGFAEYGFDISHLLKKHPYDLSGGEQQLCALIKVLASKPKVLLLDEPTKGADSVLKQKIAEILINLKTLGISMIIVSHDIEFASICADRCAMLFGGEIVSEGEPHEFFSQNSFYTTASNKIMRSFDNRIITVDEAVSSLALLDKQQLL